MYGIDGAAGPLQLPVRNRSWYGRENLLDVLGIERFRTRSERDEVGEDDLTILRSRRRSGALMRGV